MKKGFFLVVFVSAFFASCEKEEKPYKLPEPGIAKVQQVSMGTDYSKVIFYNLNTETFVVEELAFWDLALESDANGFRALMNGGTGVAVAATGDTSFDKSYNIGIAEWRWDPPSQNTDSTAIGDWASPTFNVSREVYLLDRSVNTKIERYKKFQLLEVSSSYYRIRIANLDGSNEQTVKVSKDPKVSFVYLHLDNGPLDKFEPNKEDWDFMFTRYRYVYFDMTPIIPYEVNGVLLNPYKVTAAAITMDFDSLTFPMALQLDYTNRRDFIGFDWKRYDFDKEAYITDMKRVVVIKSHSGNYFKLRFIDFYDDNGIKGAPTFEFLKLN